MDKFNFFRSYMDALEDLPPEDFKNAIMAICKYAFEGDESELTGAAKVAFKLIKPVIDKGEEIRTARADAGKRGALKRWSDDSKPIANDSKRIAKNSKPIANDSKSIANDSGIGIGIGIGKGYIYILDKWNAIPGITKITKLSESRKRAIKARFSEYGEDSFDKVIDAIKESDFLQGKSGSWKVSFDWVFKASNYPKILEGNYKNRNKIHKFSSERDIDFEQLEKELLNK